MESHQEIVLRMFEAVSSGIPFEQQWEGDLRRLGDVDVSNSEGRTLLQYAVIQGRRDWVKVLVALGAEVSGDSGKKALELASEMSTQHPEDWQRQAIIDVLEVSVLRERKERHDGVVISEEKSPSVPHKLNLKWLEDLLGVKLATCGKRVKLPAEVLQRLKETVDQNGNSLLMSAAIEGNFECVDLLLRCGAQVNASRTLDGEERRAIDCALERGHESIVKLILQWDSLMPRLYEEDPEDWLMSMAMEDQNIEDLFQRREDFHKKVREGDEDGIREMVSSGEGKEDSCGHPRYWVNRVGRSALLTAVYYGKPGVLTLLIRLNFECLEHEKCEVEIELKNDGNKKLEYNLASMHKFERIKGNTVLVMTLKSLMREGEVGSNGDDFIQDVYKDANKVPEANVLMQCLKYEKDFQVIFDNKQKDISCMYQPTGPGVLGAYVSSIHRVYASAALKSRSDLVSNLVHELAHTVMHVVFENDGLPYSKGDQEREETYNSIVSTISSPEITPNCNIIIQRVTTQGYTEDYYPHELIVRVPEIMTKLILEGDNGESREPWRNDHEKELFNFYHKEVETGIKSWIESKSKTSPFDFLSRHARDVIGVGNIETPLPINHNNIHFLQVSNLALGVSHVKKSFTGIVCVDWANFSDKNQKRQLEINLLRRDITKIAVVWEKGMGDQFCEESETCSEKCPAYGFSSIKEYVTFIVPKFFTIPGGNDSIEYKWEDLSTETTEWILQRNVKFQGKDVTLKNIIENLTEESDVESIMTSITDSDVIAWLIDEEEMLTLGSELKSLWEMRGVEFIRNHPEICFERRMKIREIDLKRAISKGRDAFFFINAKEYDFREMNVGAVSYWNSKNVPDEVNCFLLEENMDPLIEKVFCSLICAQIHFSGKWWPYAHFFQVSEGMLIHVLSECMSGNCGNVNRLLADEPGCGKTVFAYDDARKAKETNPETWTEVVELSKCEKLLELWNENNFEGNGSVEDFLYNLITVGLTESQPGNIKIKLFKHFCKAKNKAILYFDGFDEICPKYKNNFSSFLKNLLKVSKVNVLVTSRNERQHLEEIPSFFAIHFVPFDKKEQIDYLNKVWTDLFKTVDDSKRADKLKSVISNLRARNDSEEKFGKVMENIERYSEDPSVEVDFSEVAVEVIEMSQPSVEGERTLSEVPLHAWMIASVYFDDNFHLPKSLELSNFYTRFVTVKLNEFFSTKVELTERLAGGVVLRSTIEQMRQNLKKYSASFFLRDPKYQPKEENLIDLVKAGVLLEKSGSFDFIHRTFGELFFSVWMLEEAKDPDVTRILVGRFLFDIEFERVRTLINELLLSSDLNTSANGGECICEISQPSELPFEGDEEFSIHFHKSFHKAVSSCHQGIIKYLAKSSKEKLANALFSMRVCECGVATRAHLGHKDSHNAFCLKYLYEINHRDLKTIHTLLTLTKENGIIEKLRDFISECGLEWAGINSKRLRGDKGSTAWLKKIIEFFSENSIK